MKWQMYTGDEMTVKKLNISPSTDLARQMWSCTIGSGSPFSLNFYNVLLTNRNQKT